MPDVFTKAKHSKVMAAIRSKGNKNIGLKLASILRTRGITGWRRHQPVPGRPDFTFRLWGWAAVVEMISCRWERVMVGSLLK